MTLRHDLLLLDVMFDKITTTTLAPLPDDSDMDMLWWENDPLLDLLNWIIDVLRPLLLLHKPLSLRMMLVCDNFDIVACCV